MEPWRGCAAFATADLFRSLRPFNNMLDLNSGIASSSRPLVNQTSQGGPARRFSIASCQSWGLPPFRGRSVRTFSQSLISDILASHCDRSSPFRIPGNFCEFESPGHLDFKSHDVVVVSTSTNRDSKSRPCDLTRSHFWQGPTAKTCLAVSSRSSPSARSSCHGVGLPALPSRPVEQFHALQTWKFSEATTFTGRLEAGTVSRL